MATPSQSGRSVPALTTEELLEAQARLAQTSKTIDALLGNDQPTERTAAFLVAEDGTFLKVSDYFCELVGYPREELIGMIFTALLRPGEVVRETEAELLELCFKVRDGELEYADIDSWIRARDGEKLHICAHVTWHANDSAWLVLVEPADLAELTFDAQRTITSVSDGFLRLFGWRRDQLLGKNAGILQGRVSPDPEQSNDALERAVMQPLQRGTLAHSAFTLWVYRGDGQTREDVHAEAWPHGQGGLRARLTPLRKLAVAAAGASLDLLDGRLDGFVNILMQCERYARL